MGYYGDHMKEMKDHAYKEKQLAKGLESLRIKLGTKDDQGRPFVEYRSASGRLGVYILLAETTVHNAMTQTTTPRCLLGFTTGKKMPDGKDGFWVDKAKVVFHPESTPPPASGK